MGISKFNRNKLINWGIETEGFKYVKLSTLKPDTVYPLFGMFITKDTGYGEGAVLIMGDCFVNIPERYVDIVKAIMSDDESVADIKAAKCGFKYTEFTSKTHHRTGYAVEFVEL